MQNKHPEKCVNCGEGIPLGAFFEGFFLCANCDARKGEIIFELKAALQGTHVKSDNDGGQYIDASGRLWTHN